MNAYILKAVVLREQGEPDQALVSLGQALHLAEPERYIRSFLDQGAPMGALLKNAIAAGINALTPTNCLQHYRRMYLERQLNEASTFLRLKSHKTRNRSAPAVRDNFTIGGNRI